MMKTILKFWNNLELPPDFVRLMLINSLIISLFRVFETLYILVVFNEQEHLILSEFFGLIYDIFTVNTLLIFLIPLYIFLKNRNDTWVDTLFLNGIGFFALLHVPILIYFLYQLEVLDFFLWNTSIDESFFTMRSSGISYFALLIPVMLISVMLTLLHIFSKKIDIHPFFQTRKFTIAFLLMTMFFQLVYVFSFNRFSASKSLHLFAKSVIYVMTPKDRGEHYEETDVISFRNLDKSKLYLTTEYPLLHLLDTTDHLGTSFNPFEKAPNIVVLIVEGLSDDFLHTYRGVDLMPQLNKIKDQGLYWNRCFSLGERSFAVVPSLMGSLPYGEIGFTILDQYPRHVSLIPLLKSNGYHTAYFYGQIAWFHQKERFFKFNHIDLIFDKRNYSDKFEKSLVGTEKFFWGFHDKNLFAQSLEVMDTFPQKPRLSIFFTGSMHAPFVIKDEKYYDDKFDAIISNLKAREDREFFKTYQKYFKSILFFDDAVGKFIEDFKKTPGYENTVFVLTGDHAMSEIPVKNSIKRYHVPLIIFGDKLKQPAEFKHYVSHLDFYETLLPFLAPYINNIPEKTAALGSNLFNKEERYFAFMNNNREMIDFYLDGYFLNGNRVYQVTNDMQLKHIKDKEKKILLKEKLNVFKKTNAYVSMQDKIISDSLFFESVKHQNLKTINIKESLEFSEKKYVLVKAFPVPKKDLFVEIDFQMNTRRTDLDLVIEIRDETNKILYSNTNEIRLKKNYFYEYITVPAIKNDTGSLTFEAYFHNPEGHKIMFKKLRVLIHSEK